MDGPALIVESRQTARAAGLRYASDEQPGIRRRRAGKGECSDSDVRVEVEADSEILRYCVEKGSVTIDGVSLTIAALDADTFSVALVPHTLEVTTLSGVVPGGLVNLEVDVLAKYVERLLPSGESNAGRATIRT